MDEITPPPAAIAHNTMVDDPSNPEPTVDSVTREEADPTTTTASGDDTAVGESGFPTNAVMDAALRVSGFAVEATKAGYDREQALLADNERLHDLAYTDKVTELPNRLAFDEELDFRIKQGSIRALAIIDANGFKSVNDTYGHDHGDRTLYGIARKLEASVRGDDYVARIGGDEFAIIFNDEKRSNGELSLKQQLDGIAATTRAGVSELAEIAALDTLHVGAAVGIVPYESGMGADALKLAADKAMYEDKAAQKAAQESKAN